MQGFLDIALAFPTLIYSFMLVITLLYWLFVIFGALDLELFDSVLEGLGEGAAGAVDAAAHGAIDAAAHGAAEAAAHGAADGMMEAGHSALAETFSILGSLGLKKIPVTLAGSLIILFAWPTCYFLARFARELPAEGAIGILIAAGVFVFSSMLGIAGASLVARPLSPIFDYHTQSAGVLIVGEMVTIKSTVVNERAGQGEFNDGGAGLILNLRCAIDNTLKKGTKAVIVDYDPDTDFYEVAPLTNLGTESQVSVREPGRSKEIQRTQETQ